MIIIYYSTILLTELVKLGLPSDSPSSLLIVSLVDCFFFLIIIYPIIAPIIRMIPTIIKMNSVVGEVDEFADS
jgi:hypothetical protein